MRELLIICIIGIIEVVSYGHHRSNHYGSNHHDYPYRREWLDFKERFKKSYSCNLEESRRRNIFIDNYQRIARHNELFDRGEEYFTMSVNPYTDLAEDEFDKMMNGYNATEDMKDIDAENIEDLEDGDDILEEETDDILEPHINDNIDDYDDDDDSDDDYDNNYGNRHKRRLTKRYIRRTSYILPQKKLKKHSHKKAKSYSKKHSKRSPSYIDWRKKGAVTEVKNQRQCGSCWAFSATGAIEAQFFRKTRQLISLSEQNLVDCTKYGNKGCGGGWPKNAFLYLKKKNYISASINYPYTAVDGTCRNVPKQTNIVVKGYKRIPISEYKLKQAVAQRGPVAVVVDASRFQFYTSGVYYDKKCSPRYHTLNHAMLVVGYGYRRKGGAYWLLKNSWGPTWGEKGYMKLARNRGNHCGISTRAVVPFL